MLDDKTPPGQTTPESRSTPEVPSYQSKLSDFSPLSVAEQTALIAVQRGEAIWFSDDIDTSELSDNPLAAYEQLKVRRTFGPANLFEFYKALDDKAEQTNASELKDNFLWAASLSARETLLLDQVTHIDEPENYAAELRPTEKTTNNCIRAEFLRGLLLGLDGFPTVDPRGIQLYGAFITGTLNLNHAQDVPALSLHYCVVEEEILARQAEIGELQLAGCEVNGISAQGMHIKGDLWLSHGFTSSKPIGFVASTIEGCLGLTGCQIDEANGYALAFSHSTISCGVQMNSAHLLETRVSGDLFFNSTVITGDFNGNGCRIKGRLFLTNTNIKGDLLLAVSHLAAKFHGPLDCHSAIIEGDVRFVGDFENKDGPALIFNNATIGGDFEFSGFQAYERAYSKSSVTGGLSLNSTTVKGHIYLYGCDIYGHSQKIPNSDIKEFQTALDFTKMTVHGGLSLGLDKYNTLYYFSVRGCCKINHATIYGVTNIYGTLHGRYDEIDLTQIKKKIIVMTLDLDGSNFGSNLNFGLDDFIGLCNFNDAAIAGTLKFLKGTYKPYILPNSIDIESTPYDYVCLQFLGTRIGRMLYIKVLTKVEGLIFLAQTTAQEYANQHMDKSTDQASYLIDAFNYEHFGGMAKYDGKMILTWLDRQIPAARSGAEFLSQPYTQAAKVLKTMGLESDAKMVLHERDKRQFASKIARKAAKGASKLRLKLQYAIPSLINNLTGYGYYPWQILYPTVLIWLFGSLVFFTAAEKGLFAPTAPEVFTAQQFKNPVCDPQQGGNWINCKIPEYPAFSAFMYSTDTLLPVMNLSQQDKWQPMSGELSLETGAPYAVLPARVNQVLPEKISTWPNFLQHLVWFQTIAGWVISMILVAVFSGVLKKD